MKVTASLFLLLCNESFTSRNVLGDEWLLSTWDALLHQGPIVVWDLRGPFYVLGQALHCIELVELSRLLRRRTGSVFSTKLSEAELLAGLLDCTSNRRN